MRFAVPLSLGLCLFASPAAAKLCGDDVAGVDVPCACGDIVVSSLVLTSDPVATGTCNADGLVVRAAEATTGVTIDLAGKTLRGSKTGTGIWVIDGGPGGAKVISSGGRAMLEGFRDGLVARGERGVSLLENVDVRYSHRDGVRIQGTDFEVREVEVNDAGRDGFLLDGRNYRCHATKALRSKRFGYFIDGQNAVVGFATGGNAALDGGNDGFHLMGSGHRLNGCEAARNRKDGVSVRGAGIQLNACRANDNGGDGIAGEGGKLAFYFNRADDNRRHGIIVGGTELVDGGGNSGSGNRGERLPRPAVQCEIGSKPCRS
jgi:hypothetical protein